LMKIVVVNDTDSHLIITHTPAKQKVKKDVATVLTYAPHNIMMDVGKWHKMYMKIAKQSSVYYFHSTKTGEQLSSATPRASFKRLFEKAGLDFTLYGSQSARRGGATAMAEAGEDEVTIKAHCTWKDDTYQRYIKTGIEKRKQATKHLDQINDSKASEKKGKHA